MSEVNLRQKLSGWEFISEAALEKFVWGNLSALFGLSPLKQQYITQGEICDILATDANGGLVILELKNTEDRYLIQQLTRYYASLLDEKPFQAIVDYDRPVQLIAIAPSYHRHNLVDRVHSRLDFRLLQFSVLCEGNDFYFVLQDLEQTIVQRYPINYQPLETGLPQSLSPPDLLLEWLSSCSTDEQEGFLRLRSKILACSPRMKETVEKRVIQYGSGKTKLCAEFCFQQKAQKPILFLWLPLPSTLLRAGTKQMVGRLRVWTDGVTISHVGHTPEGFGKMKLESEWNELPPSKRPHGLRSSLSSTSHTPVGVKGYLNLYKNPEATDYWGFFSTLATNTWIERA